MVLHTRGHVLQELLHVRGLYGPQLAAGNINQWGALFNYSHMHRNDDHTVTEIKIQLRFGGIEAEHFIAPLYTASKQQRCSFSIGAGLRWYDLAGERVLAPGSADVYIKEVAEGAKKRCVDVREYSEVAAPGVRFGVAGMRVSFAGFCTAYDATCESQWAAQEPIRAMLSVVERIASSRQLSISYGCDYARHLAKDFFIPPLYASAVVSTKDSALWIDALREATRLTTLHINSSTADGSLFHLHLSRISPVRIVFWASDGEFKPNKQAFPSHTTAYDAAMCKKCTDCNVLQDMVVLFGSVLNAAESQCIFFSKIKSTNYPIFKNCSLVC